jgi:hypothetical protein
LLVLWRLSATRLSGLINVYPWPIKFGRASIGRLVNPIAAIFDSLLPPHSSLRARALAAARGSLDDGSELSLLAQLVSDAIGLGNMSGEVALVLTGDGFAGAANVIDAGFFMIGRWLFGVHG